MPDHEAENAVQSSSLILPAEASGKAASGEEADEELMVRYAKGDAGAFEELYRRYKGPVFRFILRSVNGDREAAEDLFHEVMMKVIGAAARYKPTAKFNTWLFRIARNACIDAARRRKFEPQKRLSDQAAQDMEGVTVEDVSAGKGQSPEEDASDSQTREAIACLMEELNPDQREVFLLREVEGLSFQEVAQIAGCTESTAKSRMRYAVNHLANGLKKMGISP